MANATRREAILFLLGVSGCLGGCASANLLGPKTPDLPKDCVWVVLPYSFVCLHGTPYEGKESADLRETADRVESAALQAVVADYWEDIPYVRSTPQ